MKFDSTSSSDNAVKVTVIFSTQGNILYRKIKLQKFKYVYSLENFVCNNRRENKSIISVGIQSIYGCVKHLF